MSRPTSDERYGNNMPPKPSKSELVSAIILAGIALVAVGLAIVADWPL